MGDPTAGGMADRPTEFLVGDFLAGNRLDHIGARDVHLTRALHHEDKVGYCRGIDGAPRRRAEDHRDLGHHTGEQSISQEDITVGGQA